ncbi:CHAT domain-containing protein [Archangium gephyra]|uniref:CHAT domain-containing tetratricopeptide repeat protein n=1 Tax=Archangium gephyra TaxID=48 RepID=UPI0035D51CD9
MGRVLGWMTVVMLCCTAGAAVAEEGGDARRVEAQAAFDEAAKLKDAGRYSEALARAGHALALREAALGSTHPDFASCLHQVGDLYRRQGDLARAEPLLRRALAIREAALGENHPDVASSLNNLAILASAQGLYDRAEPLFQRALAIQEAIPGNDPLRLASALNNLANLYSDKGLYGQAEPLLQRALALYEAAPGNNAVLIAYALNNLAGLYVQQGSYGRAEPLYQRALTLQESLGKNHPDVATALNNQANLYVQQGLYGRAEPLFHRALAIREAALGKNHPDLAISLNNLATLYINQGLYGRAGPLTQRALAIQEAVFGKNHPGVAYTLSIRARLYMRQGLYGRAEPLLQRALAIQDAVYGKNHPDVELSLHDFALLRLAQHRLPEALPLFTRALAISEQHLRQELLGFSESRLTLFLQQLRTTEQVLYSLVREHPKDTRVRRLALSAVLLRKGRSIEETASISRSLYRSMGAEERDRLERLRGLRTQLASLSLAGPGSLTPADHQRRLAALASEGDALEADLAQRSAPLRALTRLPPPAEIVDQVAASLPRDGALVELIAYVDSPLGPQRGPPQSTSQGQLRYLALVLFPDTSTRALDLGPAAPIDLAATHLRDELARRDARFQTSAQALYELAFRPLLPLLGNTRRLFLSPDGQLGLVPFAALHDGHHFLLDSFDFTYLTSGRDLLPRLQDRPPSSSVFVLADPDFHASPRTSPVAALGNAPTLAATRADLAATPWTSLPGTRQEAESIQRLLPQTQLFLGPEATKERLFHLPTPGVLHLATHGFFLEDAPVPEGSRAVVKFGALGDGAPAPRPPDPLLRSGLILAGAPPTGPATPDAASPPPDTAPVTALELAGLNLWGTQLVVLSACDTGRGDVQLGQGVFGLRRAFVVAGAETVVMSLWKVNDETTRALMEAYYRNLLEGQGRSTALREAMRSLRLTQAHPHYWAPFISVGSDAPLRALASPPQPTPDGKPVRGR